MNQGHQYTIGPQFSYIKSVSYTFTALSLFVHKTGVKQQQNILWYVTAVIKMKQRLYQFKKITV